MKKILILALVALVAGFSSCKKDESTPLINQNKTAQATPQTADKRVSKCDAIPQTCGTAQVVELIAGQHINVGTVSIANGPTNMTVTYSTIDNWTLRDIHLFVGDCAHMPVNKEGEPSPGRFPYTVNLSGGVHTYTFTIPLSGLGSCVCIAAQAEVSCGRNTETAWGAGTKFTQRCGWATYFNYCKQSCGGSACIIPANLLFSGESAWPNGVNSIVVGGYTYTLATIMPVLSAPSGDATAALFGVATLKIYGSTISPPASVLSDAAIVESWLSTLGQLNSNSQFTASASIEASIYNVQSWEASQVCH